jgi:hypothetical protein
MKVHPAVLEAYMPNGLFGKQAQRWAKMVIQLAINQRHQSPECIGE